MDNDGVVHKALVNVSVDSEIWCPPPGVLSYVGLECPLRASGKLRVRQQELLQKKTIDFIPW